MNDVLHRILKEKLSDIINEIRSNMIQRFSVQLPYDEAQSMLMDEATVTALQRAGKLMRRENTYYNYKLGENVTINLRCNGGNNMPCIFFPTDELTNFSEEFLDLIRPLYLITKSWQDVSLAFEAVVKIIQDTRELNFYVPWLRHIIPEKDFTNQFNSKFRVTQWLELDRETHVTINMITKQIQQILTNEYTSKRTWLPSDLVFMVRQGEELVTQYNIMKSVSVTDNRFAEDMVFIDLVINVKNHPTIKWASEAHAHRTMQEAERIREQDKKRAEKIKKGGW